jgi:plastocyanin
MPGRRWVRATLGAVAVLAVLGSGCAKKAITPGGSGTTSPLASTGNSGYGGYGGRGDYGGGQGSPSSPGGVGKGAIVQQGAGGQLVFAPTSLSVKQDVTIMVSNVSANTAHTFTIAGKGIDIINDPGQSRSVAIDLAPGTYQFVCRFHQSSGMTGTLTVTG